MTDVALRIAGEQGLRDCLDAVRRLAQLPPASDDPLAVRAVAAVHALAMLGTATDRALLEKIVVVSGHERIRAAATAALGRLGS